MAGSRSSAQDLNYILQKLVTYFHEYQIRNWFISYGTLLGIIRNDSCINHDDDVDIIIDQSEKQRLERLIKEKGMRYWLKKPDIFKIFVEPRKPTVDLYFSTMDNENDYNDTWNKVIWSNCVPISQREWNGTLLQIPHDAETKLVNRYGDDWKIPMKTKGVSPPKKVV